MAETYGMLLISLQNLSKLNGVFIPYLTIFAKICHTAAMEDSAMATMNISLPDPMKDWVETQAQGGRYSNTSDYVRDLIRKDQDRTSKIANMQRLVDEGLASGVCEKSIAEIRKEARARAGVTTNGSDGV